ncbi:hypothetical protein DN601_10430 [Klebsiella quasipneumoniae subsp. similipneumoniae]|nr:hypothetical protein DN601_10430 [Klebsiella quasipneumoniae subsp. similipneumoniae]
MGRGWTNDADRRPGKAQPPPGIKAAPYPLSSPGGAALTGPTMCQLVTGTCRPGKAQPPPGIKRLRTRCHRPVTLRLPGLRCISL